MAERDWSQPESYHPSYWSWAGRARAASTLIRPGYRWVCDIGCGNQHLKWFLPRSAVYLPADLNQWTANTEVCDLNAMALPTRSLAACDVAVMLGVIEYLRDPAQVFSALATSAEHLVVSYRTNELRPQRKADWFNAYTLAQLVDLLTHAGFEICELRTFRQQVIIRLDSWQFEAEQAAARSDARAACSIAPHRKTAGDTLRQLYFLLRTRAAIRAIE